METNEKKIERLGNEMKQLKKRFLRKIVIVFVGLIGLALFMTWLTAEYSESHYEAVIIANQQENDSILIVRDLQTAKLIKTHEATVTFLCDMNSNLEGDLTQQTRRTTRLQKSYSQANETIVFQGEEILRLFEVTDSLEILKNILTDELDDNIIEKEVLKIRIEDLILKVNNSEQLRLLSQDYLLTWKECAVANGSVIETILNKKDRWNKHFFGIETNTYVLSPRGERKFR